MSVTVTRERLARPPAADGAYPGYTAQAGIRARTAAWFDRYASERARWRARNWYYYAEIRRLVQATIPPGSRVLELGCGIGDLLADVKPSLGVGIDLSHESLRVARQRHGGGRGAARGSTGSLLFLRGDAQAVPLNTTFDYIICSDLLGHLEDIQATLAALHAVCTPETKVVITYWNFIWQTILALAERLGAKMPEPPLNWLGMADVDNLLAVTDFATLERGLRLMLPKPVPIVAPFLNRVLVNTRAVRHLSLVTYWVVRPRAVRPRPEPLSCTVVVPCRNEEDNIAACVERLPALGTHTELIFVDGASTDSTRQRILEQIERYDGRRDIKLLDQVPDPANPPPPAIAPFAASTGSVPGGSNGAVAQDHAVVRANGRVARGVTVDSVRSSPDSDQPAPRPTIGQAGGRTTDLAAAPVKMLKLGKGDAVRKGFAAASGDVLFILDADLTVPPEELPKFLEPIATGKADFVNGTRLVYPLEDEAMRPLNLIGNKFFSVVFTWLLGQRIKDTLCGTKVLRKRDYDVLAAHRSYFGDFDPFGDFDLLFGAARLGLRIVEVPVRYRRRTSGYSKVQVFQHGLLLLKMSLIGFRRLKLARWLRQPG